MTSQAAFPAEQRVAQHGQRAAASRLRAGRGHASGNISGATACTPLQLAACPTLAHSPGQTLHQQSRKQTRWQAEAQAEAEAQAGAPAWACLRLQVCQQGDVPARQPVKAGSRLSRCARLVPGKRRRPHSEQLAKLRAGRGCAAFRRRHDAAWPAALGFFNLRNVSAGSLLKREQVC